MPYYVQVEIKESAEHGRGVFAAQDIPKGALVWSLLPWADMADQIKPPIGWDAQPNEVFTQEELEKMAEDKPEEIKEVLWGGYAPPKHEVRATK